MKKILAVLCVLLCTLCLVSAEGVTSTEVNVAYQFPVAAMLSGKVTYTIPCLTGDGSNPLFAGNNLALAAYGEVNPLAAGADFSATLTPIPFLVFTGGVYTGSGWNFMGVEGIGASEDHIPLYYKPYAKVLFQFDAGAVVPGDWSHVVTQWTYQVQYHSLAGLDAGKEFTWMGDTCTAVPGWYASGMVGYQLPAVPVIDIAGVLLEWEGTYAAGCRRSRISPMLQAVITEQDSLAAMMVFSPENGYETFAVQYTHRF